MSEGLKKLSTNCTEQDYPLGTIEAVLMAYEEKVAYEAINVTDESK